MQYLLKKTDKLRFKSDFDYVRQNGVKYVGSSLVLVVAPPPDEALRCGVICGKKFNHRAVVRNRARRLLWESFRLLKPAVCAGRLVMIPRKRITARKQPEVQRELQDLLRQAGLWHDGRHAAIRPTTCSD